VTALTITENANNHGCVELGRFVDVKMSWIYVQKNAPLFGGGWDVLCFVCV